MSGPEQERPQPEDLQEEPVWRFRGYRIRPGEFVTAMVHFYRGEITRSNTWRTRLDNTTNWAVVTTAAVLTFAFSSIEHTHAVILISFLLIGLFLVIESRRYRYYELWALRVRLMETDFFASMLESPYHSHEEWASRLVDSLHSPQFPISFLEAIGRRLRRNYIWIFLILGLAWTLKLLLFPAETHSLEVFVEHAGLGFIPGGVILGIVASFYVLIFALAFLTAGLRFSPGEVLSHEQVLGADLLRNLAKAATDLPFMQRHEQLVIVITEKPDEVGARLMNILQRGVTSLQGTGMYTGADRSVLFCAVGRSETSLVKSVVYGADPNAFLVLNPTEEVLGGGFGELRPRWRRGSRKPGEDKPSDE